MVFVAPESPTVQGKEKKTISDEFWGRNRFDQRVMSISLLVHTVV